MNYRIVFTLRKTKLCTSLRLVLYCCTKNISFKYLNLRVYPLLCRKRVLLGYLLCVIDCTCEQRSVHITIHTYTGILHILILKNRFNIKYTLKALCGLRSFRITNPCSTCNPCANPTNRFNFYLQANLRAYKSYTLTEGTIALQ